MTDTPNYKPGVGRLAVDRFQFQKHLDGENPAGFTDFRHTSDQIDMETPVIGGATNVQDTFTNIAAFINGQSGAGQGFITVGDGYDTWHAADGTNNFDPAIASLDTLLNPIFNAIIANSNIPAAYSRIAHGGIVVIKSGTYIVKAPINVPPGITLLGEGYGTKIINFSNLVASLPPTPKTPVSITTASNATPIQITSSTPTTLATGDTVNISEVGGNTAANNTWVITVVDSSNFTLNNSVGNGSYTSGGFINTLSPVFRIVADANRGVNDTAIDPNLFMFSRETRIANMVIADNFVENTILGDVYYKLPQNKTSATFFNPPPLVQQKSGSNLHLSNVYFMGRANFSSGQTVSAITGFAVGLDNTIPAATGTILKVNDCFIDGFSQPLAFNSSAGSSDYAEVSRSKVRSHGYLNGDSSSANNNCLINSNVCNLEVSDNYLYGNGNNVLTSIYLKSLPTGGAPIEQNKSRIMVVDNNIAINKLTGSGDETGYLTINTAISATNLLAYASTLTHSNNLNFDGYSAFRLYLDNSTTPQILANSSSVVLQPSGTNSNVILQPSGTGSSVSIRPSGDITLSTTAGNINIVGVSGHSTAIGVGGSGLISNITSSTLNSPNSTVSGTTVSLVSSVGDVNINAIFGGNIHIGAEGATLISNVVKGESAANETLRFGLNSVALSASPTTLTSSQYNTQLLKFTGALSSDITVVMPNQAGYAKLIDNSTTGNFNILLGVSGQAVPVAMYPGEKFWVYCDGTNVVKGSIKNRVLNIGTYANIGIGYGSVLSSTTSGSFVDSVALVSINGCRTNDYVIINGMLTGSSTVAMESLITVVDGSTTDLTETTSQFTSSSFVQVPLVAVRTLTGTNSFTTTVKIRFRSISAGTSFVSGPTSLTVQLVRP